MLPHCIICNNVLSGRVRVNLYNEPFCESHLADYVNCSYCPGLVDPNIVRNSRSGQARCMHCKANAVETGQKADILFDEVVNWLGAQGLRYNRLPLKVELREPNNLIDPHGRTNPLGMTMYYTNGGRVVIIEGVAIRHGLPATLYQGVIAHELGHVWLAVHNVLGLQAWSNEGFCELLAHRYYQNLNTVESNYYQKTIEHNSHPTYREGYRKLENIANTVGWASLLRSLQYNKQLPVI